MNVYTTDRIRNVVLLGHGGCGKTSLVPGGGEWREWEEFVLPHVVKELLHNLMFSL